MRHDLHYVEELSRGNRPIGKIIDIDRLQPNPDQPRTEIGDLTELSASIKEKGVLEPLLVLANGDGTYMIIAGERRWRASKLAALTEVPCVVVDTDERGVAEIALIENLQRKDLNIWEEADGLRALAEKFGYTQDQIAQKISKSRSTVTEMMSIAGLPENIRERCRALNIASKATLLDIARQFDEAAMQSYLANYPQIKKEKEAAKRAERTPEADGRRRISRPTKHASRDQGTFRYRSEEGGYTVDIQFDSPSDHNKQNVLAALKTAFDDIKAGKSGI